MSGEIAVSVSREIGSDRKRGTRCTVDTLPSWMVFYEIGTHTSQTALEYHGAYDR